MTPELLVQFEGRTLRVRLSGTRPPIVADIEGVEKVVDWRRLDEDTLLLLIDGRSTVVELNPTREGVTVGLGGRRIRARVGSRELERNEHAGAAEGSKEARSPLGGSVTAVFVTAGETVEAGQTLVTVEAMKMENEIRATAAGTVQAVHVQPGAIVAENEILVVFA